MVIYVVSDTHGVYKPFLEKIINRKKPDLIFHLGDYVEDAKAIRETTELTVYDVRGNNDYQNIDVPLLRIIEIQNHRIMLVHGHIENVHFSLQNIYYKAEENNVDIALFGHTHVPFYDEINGIKFINPGSATLPRNNSTKSFLKLGLNDKINVEFETL